MLEMAVVVKPLLLNARGKSFYMHIAVEFYWSRTYFSAHEISTVTYKDKKPKAQFVCLFLPLLALQTII